MRGRRVLGPFSRIGGRTAPSDGVNPVLAKWYAAIQARLAGLPREQQASAAAPLVGDELNRLYDAQTRQIVKRVLKRGRGTVQGSGA